MEIRTDLMIRDLREALDEEVRACRRCDGMNEKGVTQAAPGWGNEFSPVVIVGQSLCEQCMFREPPEPFYERSGTLLDLAFDKADCKKEDLFITNVVHCHPPENRASHTHEIVNCSEYLYRELEIVRPSLVIGLGKDAERVLTFFYPTARHLREPFETPKNVRSKKVPCLFFATHPAYIKRDHNEANRTAYVAGLANAIRWSRSKGPLQPVVPFRTCEGFGPEPVNADGDS